jgi:mycothiol synthase
MSRSEVAGASRPGVHPATEPVSGPMNLVPSGRSAPRTGVGGWLVTSEMVSLREQRRSQVCRTCFQAKRPGLSSISGVQLPRSVTDAVIVTCWVSASVVWAVTPVLLARRAGRVRERHRGVSSPYLLLILPALALLPIGHFLALRVAWVQIVGGALLISATGFAIWSRLALGAMWSAVPSVKEMHELHTTGPYSVTRHPIYTGIIGMLTGTTLLSGFGTWLPVSMAATALLIGRSSTEERMMVRTFGDEYERYRTGVPRLIPHVRSRQDRRTVRARRLGSSTTTVTLERMDDGAVGRFTTGPAREGELDDVVGLIHAADEALGLVQEPIRDELSWLWHLPSFDIARDTRVVHDGGALVAYAEVTWLHPEDGGPLDLRVVVHPDHRSSAIADPLIRWGEAVAESRGSEGIRSTLPDRDEPMHDLLRSHGFVHVRSEFTMRKMLEPDEPRGSPPEGVSIRRYDRSDDRTLYEVLEASFADHWGVRPTTLESFNEDLHGESWDPSLVFLAESAGQTVGAVIPFVFETCGWVGMLGVLERWRGRGIGKALLRRGFAELASRGQREVRLGVDSQNADGAVALYEGVGMTVYRRYDIFDRGTPEAAGPAG